MLNVARSPDPRRYKRVETCRPGQLLVDGSRHPCELLDVSGGGAALMIAVRPPLGAAVVLLVAELGIIASTVIRHDEDGVALEFGVSDDRRRDIVDQLTAFLNAHLSD